MTLGRCYLDGRPSNEPYFYMRERERESSSSILISGSGRGPFSMLCLVGSCLELFFRTCLFIPASSCCLGISV